MQYEYDQSGLFFYYFLSTLLILFLTPTIFSFIPFTTTHKKEYKNTCTCPPCIEKEKEIERKKKMEPRGRGFYVKIAMATMLVACLIGIAVTETPARTGWSPFDVLGVGQDIEPKAVKKIYRKMAMQFHPDKLATLEDEAERTSGEAKFIEITKAMKVLTDENARKSWEETGDPDGQKSFALGIALPTWMVSAENKKYVMAIYILMFVLVLPLVVQKWWNRSKKVTKDGISHQTMAIFYKAVEFRNMKAATIWPRVLRVADQLSLDIPQDGGNRAFELLWAHLLRVKLNAKEKAEQSYVVGLLPRFLYGLFQISAAHQYITPTTLCIDLTAQIMQATFAERKIAELAQLPSISIATATTLQSKNVSLKDFTTISLDEQKKHLPSLSELERSRALKIAQEVPRIKIGAGVFKVIGEKIITPGATVTFALSVRFATTSVKAEEDLFATNDFELDLDDEKLDPSAAKKGAANNLHVPAHAPYYPSEKSPVWWVLLGNAEQNRMATPPVRITDLQEGKVKIVRMQLQAPDVGEYDLHAYVLCDSWVGCSEDCEVKLTVQDPPTSGQLGELEDEISEDEGLGAQLRAARGGLAAGDADSDVSDLSSEFSQDSD